MKDGQGHRDVPGGYEPPMPGAVEGGAAQVVEVQGSLGVVWRGGRWGEEGGCE